MLGNAKSPRDLYCLLKVVGAVTNIDVGDRKFEFGLAGVKYLVQDARVPEPAVRYVVGSNKAVPPITNPIVRTPVNER